MQEAISLDEPDAPLLLFLDEAFQLTSKVVDASGAAGAGAIGVLGSRPQKRVTV